MAVLHSGTPTSTTTSLSALSTTAIKDGHRGYAHPLPGFGGQSRHQHNSSTNSLEAERADRISRLAGLERVSTLRPGQQQQGQSSYSPQTTPTSTGFPQGTLQQQQISALPNAPAYFDSNGQPVAANTKMSTVGTASATGSVARTATEAGDATEVDEDGMSMDTNYRTMDVDSTSGADALDDDITTRSVGGFEDRMSDDGTASLVGFGEGANSTVSGPIYQAAVLRSQQLRDAGENRDARMINGIAVEGGGHVGTSDDNSFVDTTGTSSVPGQGSHKNANSTSRETVERILRERLDRREGQGGGASPALDTSKGSERLGDFYFEDKK